MLCTDLRLLHCTRLPCRGSSLRTEQPPKWRCTFLPRIRGMYLNWLRCVGLDCTQGRRKLPPRCSGLQRNLRSAFRQANRTCPLGKCDTLPEHSGFGISLRGRKGRWMSGCCWCIYQHHSQHNLLHPRLHPAGGKIRQGSQRRRQHPVQNGGQLGSRCRRFDPQSPGTCQTRREHTCMKQHC